MRALIFILVIIGVLLILFFAPLFRRGVEPQNLKQDIKIYDTQGKKPTPQTNGIGDQNTTTITGEIPTHKTPVDNRSGFMPRDFRGPNTPPSVQGPTGPPPGY